MKKQSLVKASIVLGIAGMFARFLGVFFRVPLIYLIGDEGMGYYQMSYPLYMFFVAVASGVPVAMSKLISEKNAVGDTQGSFEVVKESTFLMMFFGAGTSLCLLLFAEPIINVLNWDHKALYSLIGISFAPFIISIMTIYRGFFQGFQNMTPSGISQILEQIGRVVVGVGLAVILLPMGKEFAAGGAALGATAGGIMGVGYLLVKYKKVKSQLGIKKVKTNTELINKILRIAIPISIGATVGTIMSLIDSVLVPRELLEAGFDKSQAAILYGQLTGKAAVLVNIPLTLSMALCTSLIPIIAENHVLKNKLEVNKKIDLSMKLSSVIGFPCAIGLFLLAGPILGIIFRNNADGYEILRYLSISIPFVIVTQTTTSILQGTGHYVKPIINLLLGCIVKIILTVLLVKIPGINIYGAVISSISAYVVAAVLNIISMRSILKCRIYLVGSFIKPFVASLIMGVSVGATYLVTLSFIGNSGLCCLIAMFVGIIIYGLVIMLLKVFEIEEIKSRIVRN